MNGCKLTFLLLFLSSLLFAQKGNFAIGFQSGNNISTTRINNEFEGSPLKGDFFIGSSLGVVARSYLFNWKFEWGGFRNRVRVFAEYGLNARYGGYNYLYADQTTFQAQYHFQIPVLLTFRPGIQKYWYKKWKKNRIFPIVKTGFSLGTNSNQTIQKQYTFGEARLFEEVQNQRAFQIHYIGAIGIQKEFLNGRIMYLGFSYNTPFFVNNISGQLRLESIQLNEIVRLEQFGNYYSVEVQYFFGKRDAARRKRVGKLPKVIYNPRF